MKKTVQVLAMFLFVFSVTGWAQQDLWLGTWKQNMAKSKYEPGPAPKNPTTIKREAAPGGAVKTTTDGMDAQGKPTHTEYTASYDGKDNPLTGSQDWNSVSMKKMDAHTRLIINKKNGNVTRMIRSVLSPDGKTQTSASISIDAQGVVHHDITVFEKQ